MTISRNAELAALVFFPNGIRSQVVICRPMINPIVLEGLDELVEAGYVEGDSGGYVWTKTEVVPMAAYEDITQPESLNIYK